MKLIAQSGARDVVVFLLAAEATEEGIGLLHEQQGGTRLPGIRAICRPVDAMAAADFEAAFFHKIKRMNHAANEEIFHEHFVNGHKAAAAEPAPVITAAGPLGGEGFGQVVPRDRS